jgi:cytochrome c oxidase subunit 2
MTNLFKLAYIDAAIPWQIGFQDPATPTITGIIHFHNHLIYFLVVIGTLVFWLLYRAVVLFRTNDQNQNSPASKFTHSTVLEVVWTITPGILLLLIAGPSFTLLYAINNNEKPDVVLKIVGHQWYWSYQYNPVFAKSEGGDIVESPRLEFDSYIVAEDDLKKGGLRLLEVDNRVKLPVKTHINLLVSAADVLHSWAVPSLGIKIDACPGRLNSVDLFLLRKGVFYGQCSEICGVNHGFIPIVVESVSFKDFFDGVSKS